jgi:hypothetical protein
MFQAASLQNRAWLVIVIPPANGTRRASAALANG